MTMLIKWLTENWADVAIPLAVFLAAYFAGLWIRRYSLRQLTQWARRINWQGSDIVVDAIKKPFILWFLILGAYLALRISVLSPSWVEPAGHILGSLLVISIIIG